MQYEKPVWNPLRKGDYWQRKEYYKENCPAKVKEFCKQFTAGSTTHACDIVVYAINGDLALLRQPGGSYWSGIGGTSYNYGWVSLLYLSGSGWGREVWDCAPGKNGRLKKADIQGLIDKYLS